MAKRHRIATTFLLLSAGYISTPALTDADGYPLVGNVMSKGGPKPKPHPRPDGGGPRPHRADSEPGATDSDGLA